MKVKENQIFNLMDTNGRRKDVINAFQGYLTILDNLINTKQMLWDAMPNSLAQYEFYKQTIELYSDIFKKHTYYDVLDIEIKKNPDLKNALDNRNIEWIQDNQSKYFSILKMFDKGIEDRARHYTSSLVKLGFTYKTRVISPVGALLLDKTCLKRDDLEKTLPIDNINIIYLRQLLKLRIFDNTGEKFYSPFNMAIYLLLKQERISEKEFFELVQGLNPYYDFELLDNLIFNYREGGIVNINDVEIPDEIKNNSKIKESTFRKYFRNRKSKETIDKYWKFYNLLYSFWQLKKLDSLDKLLTFYENNKSCINKAFACGKNLFSVKNGSRPSIKDFVKQNKSMFNKNINIYIYSQFAMSKMLDQIREYSDTTKRIFKATGLISFDNGYVELAYKELCKYIFLEDIVKSHIYSSTSSETTSNINYNCYSNYEFDKDSYFSSITTLSQIYEYTYEQVQENIAKIKVAFQNADIEEISNIIASNRIKEFNKYIDEVYPLPKVVNILKLFNDRSNDQKIKDLVSSDATVSTIYEYIVGIVWYYFSGKRIDLLSSYNLTLSANFEPLVHAGGGQGDIVIYEQDKVVMLEATLMNLSSQKRSEWEPVLRHSVNLKIEEEIKNTKRVVITFFIADEFDYNTINIWKAVTAIPMQSSFHKDRFTDNVVIMPINSAELCKLAHKSKNYDDIINKVHNYFKFNKENEDINWREIFIKEILEK